MHAYKEHPGFLSENPVYLSENTSFVSDMYESKNFFSDIIDSARKTQENLGFHEVIMVFFEWKTLSFLSENRDFLVTGDDFGKVKIFNAPCVVHHAPARTHGGHSSHVMNVRWLLGDRKVISVGGWDEAVMLWRVVGAGNGSGKLQTSAWKPITGWKGC